MRQFLILAILFLLAISVHANSNMLFNKEDFVPNTIIFCLREEAIGSRRGEISVSRTRGTYKTTYFSEER